MADIHAIHDKTFKTSMADVRVARDFLEEYLPSAILSLIDLNSLKLSPNSYVDDNLNTFSSDVLYQVKMGNTWGYIYLLCEHQSSVDPLMAFRLWNYIIKIWADHLKQTGEKALPFIFPLVFYHGKEPYDGCRNLRDLIQAPIDIIEDFLFKPFHLIDTNEIKDEDLRERLWSGIMAFMFKHVYDRDVWPLLSSVIEMIKRIEQEDGADIYANNLLKYWLVTAESKKGARAFIEKVEEGLNIPIGGEIMTMAEELIQQGKSAQLLSQLEYKFKAIPERFKQKINQASPENLLKFGRKLLDAKELEEVFNN